jgi:hypothetical protein
MMTRLTPGFTPTASTVRESSRTLPAKSTRTVLKDHPFFVAICCLTCSTCGPTRCDSFRGRHLRNTATHSVRGSHVELDGAANDSLGGHFERASIAGGSHAGSTGSSAQEQSSRRRIAESIQTTITTQLRMPRDPAHKDGRSVERARPWSSQRAPVGVEGRAVAGGARGGPAR